MRPAQTSDIYVADLPDGAYVLSYHGRVRFRGRSVARWLSRLLPYLDGTRSLDELVAGLQRDQQQVVERIVTSLHRAGLVRDASPAAPAVVPRNGASTAAGGGSDVARLLGYFLDDGDRAYADYCQRSALVIGEGAIASAVAQAAIRSGLSATLDRAPPDNPGRSDERIVFHIDDAPGARAVVIERLCAQRSVPLVHIVVDGRRAWLLPVLGHGELAWAAAQPRIPFHQTAEAGRPFSDAAAATIASQAVQCVLLGLTGAVTNVEPHQIREVDLDTLETTRRAVLAHPSALPVQPESKDAFLARIAQLGAGDTVEEADFALRAAGCADDRIGILSVGEQDWAQTPLHVSQATLRADWPEPGQRRPPSIIAAALGHRAARCRAVAQGLALHCARTVDPRRFVRGATDASGSPKSATEGIVWAADLLDCERALQVPASVAFPGWRPTRGVVQARVAAGYCWKDAVRDGLLAHVRRLTIKEALASDRRCPRVEVRAEDLDEEGARYVRLLDDLGLRPDVYDITASIGVPTFAFCEEAGTVAYTSGLSVGEAIRDGLRQALLAVQATTYRQPAYAPEPVPGLPPRLRGRGRVAADGPPLSVEAVAAALRASGMNAAIVPLDHDRAVTDVLPYLVSVVIIDAQSPELI